MTYAAARCFWIQPANRARLTLRRFTYGDRIECPAAKTMGHNASFVYGVGRSVRVHDDEFDYDHYEAVWPTKPDHSSHLWPKVCEACHDYEFHPSDEWQYASTTLYTTITGSWIGPLLEAAPGAMFDAWWYPWKGDDGLSLTVMLPNGDLWPIDRRASNCTMPNDNVHHCWVRHGTPPRVTVDKNGYTCQAGAGSILSGDYHGFLQDGMLTAG